MIAPARKFSILLMPSWRILEQSKPGGTSGLMYWDLVVTLYLKGPAGALCPAGAPRPGGFAVASSASDTPARPINSPTKTRRLKNADCEVDFFFMNGVDVDGI